jgi:predicted alpha/beta hydrolase family esterase
MVAYMTRYLFVPGRGVPFPGHWSRRSIEAHPNYRWAPEPPGPPYIAADRVAALHAEIAADDAPAAELFDAGDAGHLDTRSGYGPWPDGERLVETLTGARPPAPRG